MHSFSQSFEAGMFVRRGPENPEEKTLLFIHGLGESGLCFEKIVQRNELGSFNILLPDLPGYGRSPWPDQGPTSLEALAGHLAAWLSKSQTGPVTVIGHSMGGVIALFLAENHPDLVGMIIDVDGNKSPGDCVFSGVAAGMGLQRFLAGGFDELRGAIFAKGVDDIAQRGYYVSLRLADPHTYYRHSQDLVKLSAAENMATRLGELPIPVVYIAGFPHGASAPSRRLLESAQIKLKDIAPSGHWPFIDQEDQFISTLMESLSGE